MFRMNCMLRAHGRAGAAFYTDVMYIVCAGAHKRCISRDGVYIARGQEVRSDDVQDELS